MAKNESPEQQEPYKPSIPRSARDVIMLYSYSGTWAVTDDGIALKTGSEGSESWFWRLHEIGHAMGLLDTKASENQINMIGYDLFDLTDKEIKRLEANL